MSTLYYKRFLLFSTIVDCVGRGIFLFLIKPFPLRKYNFIIFNLRYSILEMDSFRCFNLVSSVLNYSVTEIIVDKGCCLSLYVVF